MLDTNFLVWIIALIHIRRIKYFMFFFFNDTATTEIYTLSLHDALPISMRTAASSSSGRSGRSRRPWRRWAGRPPRSEEHTSELQSQSNIVCRLLLEKKKYKKEDTNKRPFPNANNNYTNTMDQCIPVALL